MPTDPAHPSTVGASARYDGTTAADYTNDPTLPPQRHAGAVGLGPNYPLGPGLGDMIEGIAEEVKGKILRKPELVEHGRERRSGELFRKERERDNANDPFGHGRK